MWTRLLFLAALLSCVDLQGRVPVIYSTDLFHPHDDPDDHFDLATLFAIPEFDIRAIVLDLGHLQRKAPGDLPVKQLGHLTGRPAPLLVGLQNPLRYPEDKALNQFVPETPNAILRLIKESESKVMLIATGSVRDFAAAYNRDPDLFRAKVARLYIADGNSAGGDLQWNPRLDPQAYLRLMRSDLPIYWAPGFGGSETLADLASGKLGTKEYQAYWKFRQGDLLESLPRSLQNYFLYALGRKEASHEDPIEYLKRVELEEPLRSQQWSQTRHMWSTVALYDAAGRSIYRKGDSWSILSRPEPGFERANVYEFVPASVSLDRDLRTTLKVPGNGGAFRVLRVRDLANYQGAMLGSLRGLLSGMMPKPGASTGFGRGAGSWPAEGAIYEVSPEYFPNHSLNELTERIPRLKKLGVSVIYLTPIFKCLGKAQYLITDFYAINPRYGTEADLKSLIATAHAHGIRILLDLVTSLTYEGTGIMEKHADWILVGDDGTRQRYYPMPVFVWALDCAKPGVIPASNSGLKATNIAAVAVSPRDPAVVHAAVYGAGLFNSADGGKTWDWGSFGGNIVSLLPHSSGTLFANANGGAFKTTDEGANWVPLGVPGILAIDPVNPNRIYAQGGFKSTDGGASWVKLAIPQSGYIAALAIDWQAPNRLYAGGTLYVGGSNNDTQQVFKSLDGGESWTATTIATGTFSWNTLAVDPLNPATVYAAFACDEYRYYYGLCKGEPPKYKSTDSGATWSPWNLPQGSSLLTFEPHGSIYGKDQSGLLKSVDRGETWSRVSAPGLTSGTSTLAIDPLNPNHLFAGTVSAGVFEITLPAAEQ